ncbi:hypothetical protein [Rhizobium jaguaris]|uniref:hypothetical protein n=1 Tax=Rhizobium jaguaris TaxID=1312183 RepID=UPI001969155D|nr:hypothetical protein [Rhizobium jaguaris]
MRRYFALREELTRLKSALEGRRKAMGIPVGEFYHVRSESEHAVDVVVRFVTLKKEMDFLMSLAEGWARGSSSVSTHWPIDPPTGDNGEATLFSVGKGWNISLELFGIARRSLIRSTDGN